MTFYLQIHLYAYTIQPNLTYLMQCCAKHKYTTHSKTFANHTVSRITTNIFNLYKTT